MNSADPADPFDLQRFVAAQAANYADAIAELRAGRKTTHWSWYVIPQLIGLGTSPMAVRYAIRSLAEARAYLAHPLLGARLRECVAAMNGLPASTTSAKQVLGDIDARKFQSCLTLFEQVAPDEPQFAVALNRYFGAQRDAATLRLLAQGDAR